MCGLDHHQRVARRASEASAFQREVDRLRGDAAVVRDVADGESLVEQTLRVILVDPLRCCHACISKHAYPCLSSVGFEATMEPVDGSDP